LRAVPTGDGSAASLPWVLCYNNDDLYEVHVIQVGCCDNGNQGEVTASLSYCSDKPDEAVLMISGKPAEFTCSKMVTYR
jgi:hypothetical protein